MSARPALRLLLVVRLVEHLRVEPADDIAAAAAAGPQRVVRVLGELQVVRAEAGVDERELLRLRIVDGESGGRCGSSGKSFADGWLEPSLQNAGLSGGRITEVNQTRPLPSNIGLCTLVWLFQMASSPQYGEGCSDRRGVEIGVFGSRTAASCCAAVLRRRIEDRQVVGARSRAHRRRGRWR